MDAPFANRTEAGRRLAAELTEYSNRDDVLVLALPRGGVPVAFEVAAILRLPLDIFVVRKLGVPYFPELAMGAIASGGVRVLNPDVLLGLPDAEAVLDEATRKETAELERRERLYRKDRQAADYKGRVVIIIDDGLATGATMRAAIAALRQSGAALIVTAVPGGAPETCEYLRKDADRVVCLHQPRNFRAVGELYGDFSQTSDEEVRGILERAPLRAADAQSASSAQAAG